MIDIAFAVSTQFNRFSTRTITPLIKVLLVCGNDEVTGRNAAASGPCSNRCLETLVPVDRADTDRSWVDPLRGGCRAVLTVRSNLMWLFFDCARVSTRGFCLDV